MSSSSNPSKEVPPYVSATYDKSTTPLVPPPVYQEGDIPLNDLPGQTYYQPPPQAPSAYPPPPIHQEPAQPMRSRVVEYYAPPDNRRLGLRRRITTLFCVLLILAVVIALIAGLTRRYHQDSRYCECRTDSDCVRLYGPNVYCYANCDCGINY